MKRMTLTEYKKLVENVKRWDRNEFGESRFLAAYGKQPFPKLGELTGLLRQLAGDDKDLNNSSLRMLVLLAEVYQAEKDSEDENRQRQLCEWLDKTIIRPIERK